MIDFILVHGTNLDNFLEALHILDLGIIMGSGLEESNRLTECAQYLHNYLVDEYAFETMESKTMPESSSYICDIDILDHPSEEHFWTKYFFLHQPAKLVNCIDLWPAITKWKDLNYLMKIAGYRTVPIELGKKYDNDDWSQGMFRFGEFLKTFMSTQSDTNQIAYLAQHDLFDQIPELRKDFSIPDYCAVGTGETIIKSWIGPANTISTMHTDDKHNLLCQVFGEKLIILASPDQSDNLYPYEGMLSNTCQIDPENLNFTKFPLTKNVKFLKLILKPGEILFIPKLWFHYVKSLSPSISLSFWFEVNETKPGVEQTADFDIVILQIKFFLLTSRNGILHKFTSFIQPLLINIMKFVALVLFCVVKFSHQKISKPNVVIIMADDHGFNDVGFRGSNEIPTPNIDALAYNGVILNRFYTPPLCTPSRSSFYTGKYPHRMGMQHFVIPADEPWKTPMFLLLNHLAPHAGNADFPLQAPPEEIEKFSYIEDETRRALAAMISIMDRSIGKVVSALEKNEMLANTIIVYYSDNGGPTIGSQSTRASNYPLRGQKRSPWEGGVRTNAVVYAPFLKKSKELTNQLFHVSDLLPTLMKLAGIKLNNEMKLDGVDQWKVINEGARTTRTSIENFDNIVGFGSYIRQQYKLVRGTTNNEYDGWLSNKTSSGIIEDVANVANVLIDDNSLQKQEMPNVVIIMADDHGFSDVSFRGSNEIPTPNIDALAYNGVILNRFYTPPLCTPSRSSFLTGKYPHRMGMQHFVIPADEPWGLPLNEKIMPQYFKEAGYTTNLIGKWHLGFFQQQYTPSERGFDNFFGYLGPYIDYFDFTHKKFNRNFSRGFDLRRNLSVAEDLKFNKSETENYATDLFKNEAVKIIENHDKETPMFLLLNHLAPHAGNEDFPLQAPPEEIEKFSYIEDESRRTLAAMISIMDRGIGKVVTALKKNDMLANTIIVYYSDNGGPTFGIHSTKASNYPLRGQKESPWEGGVRTNAVVYAPFLKKSKELTNQLFHVSDLLPTLMKLAGIKLNNEMKLDGVDQWKVINEGARTTRTSIENFDNIVGFGSYIRQQYKLVRGTTNNEYDGWLSNKTSSGIIEDVANVANVLIDDVIHFIKVLTSETSIAILKVSPDKPLTIPKIYELRQKATVNCGNSVDENKSCDLTKAACLFNINEDPCEQNNVAETFPLIYRRLSELYDEAVATAVPSRRKPFDPAYDHGFSDVSFRGSNEIPTPNIDALAYNGVILNRFYTPPLCTPSRSSFLTGKYPHRMGMQHFVIPADEPWGLPLNEKIMPQYFKEAGYTTNLIGKWHLGFFQQQYTPSERGFDNFFGYLGPYIDYFDFTHKKFNRNFSRGFDLRRNLSVAEDLKFNKSETENYATDLFTNEAVKIIENHDKETPMFLLLNHLAPHAGNADFPLQAPPEEIEKFSYIEDETRRVLAAMISIMDRGIGKVVSALEKNEMLANTIIVYYSDNGGPTIGSQSTRASNYPLRGQKRSPWEGGVRTNAVVYAPFLKKSKELTNQLFHVSDLLPTLMNLAGIKLNNDMKLDGVDQWKVINEGAKTTRTSIENLDNISSFGSYISQQYKLVRGTTNNEYDGWLSNKSEGIIDGVTYVAKVLTSETSIAILKVSPDKPLTIPKIYELRQKATVNCGNSVDENKSCDLTKAACLFNINEDPCEQNNVAENFPLIYRRLLELYDEAVATAVPSRRKSFDPACDPINFDFNWQWWENDS
ncbi:CLUMA_CG012868, isoform A [Clunio marinus]|uniref:CLUMA_CG012868, isoform A n=1 Tax=Clunio marinus TaxID=568069 RepID=A0A1J1IH10_9DIPT|nr:CLUMA_CG012868, isoform A [Clunio marinus]